MLVWSGNQWQESSPKQETPEEVWRKRSCPHSVNRASASNASQGVAKTWASTRDTLQRAAWAQGNNGGSPPVAWYGSVTTVTRGRGTGRGRDSDPNPQWMGVREFQGLRYILSATSANKSQRMLITSRIVFEVLVSFSQFPVSVLFRSLSFPMFYTKEMLQ